jgi:KipI family sensor histidine kinase inhibitor
MTAAGVVRPYGDAGILVEFGALGRDAAWARAQAVGAGLLAAAPQGLRDVVATFDAVFVDFDPLVTSARRIEAAVRRCERTPPPRPPAREIEIDVAYGGEDGPDLAVAAAALGISPQELVRLHTEAIWTIRFFAAPVGAPMMDGPPLPRPLPRRSEPRLRVPAGSVAISGQQTVIYPVEAPGGWQLIGRTCARLVDPQATPMTAYRPGDQVCFRG